MSGFWTNSEDVIVGSIVTQVGDFINFHSTPNIIWEGCDFKLACLKEEDYLEDLSVDVKIILK